MIDFSFAPGRARARPNDKEQMALCAIWPLRRMPSECKHTRDDRLSSGDDRSIRSAARNEPRARPGRTLSIIVVAPEVCARAQISFGVQSIIVRRRRREGFQEWRSLRGRGRPLGRYFDCALSTSTMRKSTEHTVDNDAAAVAAYLR